MSLSEACTARSHVAYPLTLNPTIQQTMINPITVGIAGAGKMGSAIAQRLLEKGFSVSVWNRTSSRLQTLLQAGALAAQTPSALSQSCQVVISSLTDEAALDAVYRQPGGLLEPLTSPSTKRALFIEMSTVRPATQIHLCQAVQAAGARFVECPVGGTVGPAREGKLLGLVGGAPDDIERARPVLEALCRRLAHVGEVGSAAAMKLAINLPLILSWQAVGEALAVVRNCGLEPALMVDLLADSSGASTALRNRSAVLLAALSGDPTPGAYDVDTMRKDLNLLLQEAEQQGVSLPLTVQAAQCYDRSSASGWGSADGLAQAAYWRDHA